MKINLKQVAKLEKQFCYENPVAFNTLQKMIELVLSYNDTSYATAPDNVKLAFITLKELEVITEPVTDVIQLNS